MMFRVIWALLAHAQVLCLSMLILLFLFFLHTWFSNNSMVPKFTDMDIVNRWYRCGPFETDRLFFVCCCCWCILIAVSLATDPTITLLYWRCYVRCVKHHSHWHQQVSNKHTYTCTRTQFAWNVWNKINTRQMK